MDETNDLFEMLNRFQYIYNCKNKKTDSMIDNVNEKDPTDTNESMELFYEYMQLHKELYVENSDYIDVFDNVNELKKDFGDNINKYDIYTLVIDKFETKYYSLSYISLLKIGTTQNISSNWSVVTL